MNFKTVKKSGVITLIIFSVITYVVLYSPFLVYKYGKTEYLMKISDDFSFFRVIFLLPVLQPLILIFQITYWNVNNEKPPFLLLGILEFIIFLLSLIIIFFMWLSPADFSILGSGSFQHTKTPIYYFIILYLIVINVFMIRLAIPCYFKRKSTQKLYKLLSLK